MFFFIEFLFKDIDLRLFIFLFKFKKLLDNSIVRDIKIQSFMCFKIKFLSGKENNWVQFIVFCCYLQVEMYINYYNLMFLDENLC